MDSRKSNFLIVTDDLLTPYLEVPLTAEFQRAITIVPNGLFFGSIPANRPTTKKVLLCLADDSPIHDLSDLKISNSAPLTITASLNADNKRQWVLTVTLDPSKRDGFVEENLRIEFKDSELSPVDIPIQAMIGESR